MVRAKRKGIGKKTRFEVFKRDKFACQYCGKQAPDVVLVIDHIHPVSKGGADLLLNYITSCEACNAGKGARVLSDDTLVAKQRAEVERLAERREQVSMMLDWHKSLQDQSQLEIDALATRWGEMVSPFYLNQLGRDQAKKWLRRFTLQDLLVSADTAATQYLKRDSEGKPTVETVNLAWSKIPGICRVSKLPADERDLYYIRGILRNRLAYINENEVMRLLTEAHDIGIDTEQLKQHACIVRTWTQWRDEILDMMDGADRARS